MDPSAAVTVPWGDWTMGIVNFLLPTALTILSGVTTYVVGAYMPPWLRAIAGTSLQARINTILEKAVLSAVARTAGAVTGQRLTVPIGIEVLRKAFQYAVDQAPDLMEHAAKGQVENLIKMLLARMEQLGVAPAEGLPAKDAVAQGGFDFGSEISKQLGK